MGSVTAAYFCVDHVVETSKRLAALKATIDLALKFPQLDLKPLRSVVYTDAGFASRVDKTAQIGYVIFLADPSGAMCVLRYKSGKSYLFCWSAMIAETLAFTAAFDAPFMLRHQIELMLQKSTPLIVLTDSKALFDVLTTNQTTGEAGLMIDVFSARQPYDRREIDSVCELRGEHNLADDLAKMNGNGKLPDAIRPGRLEHPAGDCIIRWASPHLVFPFSCVYLP